MARLTIAQLREIELNKLSEITKDQGKASNMKKVWSIYTFIIWYEEYFINH